jgi:uncharacterized membrane protein YhaH (DUF805 family)
MAYVAAGIIGVAIGVTAHAPALLLVLVIPVVLVFLLPQLAVTIRRLHDIDRSGWWFWFAYVPLVGAITLLIFCCMPGTPGPNRFGPPPHGFPAS